jgi:hypothetical protein
MRARRCALNSARRGHPKIQALSRSTFGGHPKIQAMSCSAFGVEEEAFLVSTTRRGALNSARRGHPKIQAPATMLDRNVRKI